MKFVFFFCFQMNTSKVPGKALHFFYRWAMCNFYFYTNYFWYETMVQTLEWIPSFIEKVEENRAHVAK